MFFSKTRLALLRTLLFLLNLGDVPFVNWREIRRRSVRLANWKLTKPHNTWKQFQILSNFDSWETKRSGKGQQSVDTWQGKMAGRADPWADVDFDEIMDATCLEMDDIKVLFNCFQLFDTKKQDYLLADDIDEVMRLVLIAPRRIRRRDKLALAPNGSWSE